VRTGKGTLAKLASLCSPFYARRVNRTRRREASFCLASLLVVYGSASAKDRPETHREAETAAARGGSGQRPAIVVEEDRQANEAPPPAPSGEERRLIGDHIRDHAHEIDACYAKRAQERKGLRGKLVTRFDIGPNGRVIGATADGIEDRELALCVVQVVRSWTFARPRSSAKLRVAYPWVFPPATAR
jgi:outer membrane biosynthesis protein TonB